MAAPVKAPRLEPLYYARNRQELEAAISAGATNELVKAEESLRPGSPAPFTVEGFCIPCNKEVSFLVNMEAGGREEGGRYFPNWRERLICPCCRLSNRQRLVAALVGQHLEGGSTSQSVYLMERTTPLYKWVEDKYSNHSVIGSEFLGSGVKGGTVVGALDYLMAMQRQEASSSAWHRMRLFYLMFRLRGVRHEDVCQLSFPDGSLDLVVSNDVFEHVPDAAVAFKECTRVLRPGGVVLATIPFDNTVDNTAIRARREGGGIHQLLPATYHGNPLSTKGSLVYTDFGWDIFSLVRMAGFSDGWIEVYGDERYGHIGDGLMVFRLIK